MKEKFNVGDIVINTNTNEKRIIVGVSPLALWVTRLGPGNKPLENPNAHETIPVSEDWVPFSLTNYSLLTFTFEDLREAWDACTFRFLFEEKNAPFAPDFFEYMQLKYYERMEKLIGLYS